MAEGGRVGKSWRVREAMGDKVPEANTTACACSTTCVHKQFAHVSQICRITRLRTSNLKWRGQ